MQKLAVVGSVLYVAAHPDDENTRLISYLSNGAKVRTGYLSLTRGDGGQNLIGPELGAGLGVIRTQELLEARRVDGGEQFFSRAVDFGYSKGPAETLAKWGENEVLSDVVRVIRKFRPDVIVTRFDADGSGGHGHHTAATLLARKAFALAADPDAFPEQGLAPWQTRRLFFNASIWWRRDVRAHARDHPDRWVVVNVGGYDPLLGASYTELAGRARSQHRSQGFGSEQPWGPLDEYLRLDLGKELAEPDMFDSIDLTWDRIPGGAAVGQSIQTLIDAYNPARPEESMVGLTKLLATLWETRGELQIDSAGRAWIERTIQGVEELILQVTGTVIEVRAPKPTLAVGESMETQFEAMQRGPGSGFLWTTSQSPSPVENGTVKAAPSKTLSRTGRFPAEAAVGSVRPLGVDEPYWLTSPFRTLYSPPPGYDGTEAISRPHVPFSLFPAVETGGDRYPLLHPQRYLMHTWVERVEGQRSRPVVVTPIASLTPADPVTLVTGETAEVVVEVQSMTDDLSGEVTVAVPAGWSVTSRPHAIDSLGRGERRRLTFRLRRGEDATWGPLRFRMEGPSGRADRTMHVIDYSHIVPQVWYSPAETRLVPLDVEVSVQSVGYIDGAGDDVPRALRRLGLRVDKVDPATAEPADLAKFDAIVVGIRAYNTVDAMARLQPSLMDYVKAGGTLVAQYNTASRDMVIDPRRIGPYPFQLTRGRVTVEEAPATFLLPNHPALNVPNRITAADFDGWVQERGLYFAGDLDPSYTAPIAWNDPGEAPLNGALISCDHGEGRFIYTGISFFRELPAGVPGAYRLFANLLARRQ